jgi:acyl-coenzyme A thioesterase PaaI-like protein
MSSHGTQDRIVMGPDELDRFMEQAFGQPLTWKIEHVGLDSVRVRQPMGAANSRPGGTVSGPTLMSMADGVAYLVLLSRIGPAALAVTSSLNINFLRQPRLVDLVTEGRLLKLGRSLAVVEVNQFSDSGGPEDLQRPVAQATVTYSLALLERPDDIGTT